MASTDECHKRRPNKWLLRSTRRVKIFLTKQEPPHIAYQGRDAFGGVRINEASRTRFAPGEYLAL